MKQKLTAAALCALALSFNALANVAYDKEYTNEWFKVIAASANLADTDRWAKPTDGTAEVADSKIKLDTDLDDPLTYTAANQSEDVAIVTARFEATANTAEPELNVYAKPQAALTVIVKGGETNWWGLAKGDAGNTWVKFTNVTPTVGDEYEIKIEFDLREEKRIRYSVGGTVLVDAGSTDGWYGNPQSEATAIRSVSFSGTGDIGDFGGDNVGEVTPVASVTKTSQTDGFDYTNGTLNVTLNSAAAGTATLKVIDFATGAVKAEYTQKDVASGESTISWQIADRIGSLIAGGIYSYEVTVTPESTDATHAAVTKAGTFVAANPTNDVNWFWADATSGKSVVSGGYWDDETMTVPQVEGNAYVIDDSKFVVTDTSKGSNNLTRVDVNVTFETMVDGSTLEPVDNAFGGFVAATEGGVNVWKALTAGESKSAWVTLNGDIAPAVNTPYLIRAEVSFIENNKKVRYLVKEDVDGAEFCVLKKGDSEWLPLADDSKTTLAAVEMNGSGKLAKLEATIADKALAVVNGEEYDSMDDALAAARTAGKPIQLLTNATIDPNLNQEARYEILAGGYSSVSGGKVSHGDRTIFIPGSGEPPLVRPSERVMQAVTAPGLTKSMNTDKLRTFLEKNGVKAYTENENATATDISNALKTSDTKNGLVYWQDYALGIDVGTSVAPVTTPAGDTSATDITLAIPAIDKTQYSGDYTINYQVMKGTDINPVKTVDDPSAIMIPLTNGTGTYQIKAVFTPAQ